MTELSRFTFEVLRQDEESVLYRGRSTDGSSRVLLRLPTSQDSRLQNLKGVQRAYTLKDELDPAWAVRPIEFANHWDRTVLVMEDPGGVPLDQLLGQPLDLAFSLRIAISLSSAIGHLHRRGIIHKDIKPAHVLVTPNTGQCWLMGFGISSRLRREHQSPEPPEFIAGTLSYMAPEQTGRMNRSVDSRSDLYSFGVLLYEMLTGSLPFTATDPMEWVHCHIARQPVPPSQRGVPPAISAIVMRLLAKTAEERYQTAVGVESDLRRCLHLWARRHGSDGMQFGEGASPVLQHSDTPTLRSTGIEDEDDDEYDEVFGEIREFPLGTHDITDQLRIPEKLYGRAGEIDTLLASFDRVVTSGTPGLVLVSGYSGIGKSSVVNELHKVLVPPRGLFASGKFDQYKRDIPYATLAQAFQSLIRPVLGKSEAELHNWRDALRVALGPNGRLIVDLVPELKFIIGEQPQVPDLPAQDAQRRFHLVFRRFISVFARREHPLALFLDDLQWLDAATLDFLEDLFAHMDVQYLMLVGAYRENEVSPAHPLMRKLEAIRRTEATVREIVLVPLTRKDLEELIADALRCEADRVSPLAELVHEKTVGNPFFAIQFISALAEEGLVTFDHDAARWSWNLTRIHAKGYTDNVVDLMVGKLHRLTDETQQALRLLACFGNVAEIATLCIARGTSEPELHADLWEAVRQELVMRSEGSYKFVHDRVQEAAYSLIPKELRGEAHLRIGRLLLSRTAPQEMEGKIFEVVNQLNRASELIDSLEERERVAELNLIAGKRAKTSAAYASALRYFVAGRAFLAEESWKQRYALTFALEFQRAECEFLTGDFTAAEKRLWMLSRCAADLVDNAVVARLQTDLYTALDQSDRAVGVSIEYLRRAGVDWSPHPTNDDVRQEYERIWQKLGNRPIEALIDLPPMTDPVCRATLDVLTVVEGPAFFTDQNLRCLVVARMVNLSLESGNSDGSCVAYVQLGWFVGPRFGDYQAAFRFGKLALDLVEKRGLQRFRARVSQIFGYFINPWSRHFRSSLELFRRSFITAHEAGDLKYAASSWDRLVTFLLAAGDPLGDVQREAENGLEFTRTTKFAYDADIIIGQLRFIRTLRGLTPSLSSFNDAEFDEDRFEVYLEADPHLVFATCWYWIRKLQARFYAGDYAAALAAASKAEPLLQTGPGHLEWAEYIFYGALARAADYDSASSRKQFQYGETLVAYHKQIVAWAENCPENFENRAALVGAEIARIEGRTLDAQHLYEQAIRSANANGFVQNEALANELAARFYMARGFDKIAYAYLRDARYNYVRWGAGGKVRQLDHLYPQLRAEETRSGPVGTIEAPVEHLDLATVLKVSQAVSGEIVLEKLIDMLMRTAVEHAGAERGVLVLPCGDQYRIEAEAATTGDSVVVRVPEIPAAEAAVPDSVVHYVARTHESLIIEDASAENSFSADPYFREQQARSILCLPLINQAKLIAVLYLENNLAPRIFTPARMTVLKLLAAQAAISLENTRLYRDLEKREVALQQTQAELAHVSRLTTMGELAASIAHEVNQPLVGVVTNASASLRYLDWDTPNLVETKEAIRGILRDANRAADVVSRMRSLFKRARPAKQPLNINEAIEEVVLLTRGEGRRNQVALQLELAENLPLVMADRVQIQQVVMNLILNGIQAMSAVSDRERVLTIRTKRGEGSKIRVAVQDCGIGIDPGDIERVFAAFHTTKPDGMGMGLSISRSIIESHGGELWATPNDGPGVTFRFSL